MKARTKGTAHVPTSQHWHSAVWMMGYKVLHRWAAAPLFSNKVPNNVMASMNLKLQTGFAISVGLQQLHVMWD